ncbi:unnamed protein product (macronuclear) [Paramecium tetraurelia]|uniref:SREBP regulating gene protein n=1 Tax=Paramecium tetraurelia TaxID=5888 RepID=A0BXB2_PARTE|nr:uncharacterized protein GSPATT00033032001 [Paramecium tetraurelia]CAK63179.1 unnamed protein product [Paramecium tetraurelia]|eukprot:XP_001430577.1 hypothetical protein (macronuclear) [Paramecium tetraurelia strain d4-2]
MNQRSWWLSHHAISRVANIFTSLQYNYNNKSVMSRIIRVVKTGAAYISSLIHTFQYCSDKCLKQSLMQEQQMDVYRFLHTRHRFIIIQYLYPLLVQL